MHYRSLLFALAALLVSAPAMASVPVDITVAGPDEALSAATDGSYLVTLVPRVENPYTSDWRTEVSGTVGWEVALADEEGEPLGEDAVMVSAEEGETTDPVFVRVAPPASGGEHLVLSVGFTDPSGLRYAQSFHLHFRLDGEGLLAPSSGQEWRDENTREADGTRYLVSDAGAYPEAGGEAAAEAAPDVAGGTGGQGGAATSSSDGGQAGCSAGGAGGILGLGAALVVLLLGGWGRTRRPRA